MRLFDMSPFDRKVRADLVRLGDDERTLDKNARIVRLKSRGILTRDEQDAQTIAMLIEQGYPYLAQRIAMQWCERNGISY